MKIAHIIIAADYKEGYGYQENILPAKHVQLGFDTHIITYSRTSSGGCEYINNDGVQVTMLTKNETFFNKVRGIRAFCKRTRGLYEKLVLVKPDIIFMHGLQCFDSLEICKYCKNNSNVKLYVDQHADYYNTPINKWTSGFFARNIYGFIAKRLEKYAIKFWGVTPWRVDYLQKVYGIKPENTDLLVMGGDERYIDWENREVIRNAVRAKYSIPNDAFLIISGGKIDKAKNIHLLVDAVNEMKNNVHLIIFGNMTKELEEYCLPKIRDNITYIGWVASEEVYPLFLASNFAVFPGTHSVLWEQALACGLPAIFKNWHGGFNHVDCNGNCLLLDDVNKDTLISSITKVCTCQHIYKTMQRIAETATREKFLYINIARRSINL